jgi:hypothetical protein
VPEFTLYQTESTEIRNRSEFGESSRSEVNDRSEDMKRISQNLGRFADFRYIADIQIERTRRTASCFANEKPGNCRLKTS